MNSKTTAQSSDSETPPKARFWLFLYTTAVLVLLLAVAAVFVLRGDLISTLLPKDWQRTAVQGVWFAMLGGVAISLKGLYDHQTRSDWATGNYSLWYLGRPFSSAVVGLMTYSILQVAAPSSTPSNVVLSLAAFVLGMQERRFFNLMSEVAKLVVAVPGDQPAVQTPSAVQAQFALPVSRSMPQLPLSTSGERAALPPGPLLAPAGGGVTSPSALAPSNAIATPDTRFSDHGGRVLRQVQVQLLFWGSHWAMNQTPSVVELHTAVDSILTGPYLSALRQYRGIGRGRLGGTVTIPSSDPPDPFDERDVTSLIRSQIIAGALPKPDSDPDLLYLVVMQPGVEPADKRIAGEHSYFLYWNFDFPIDLGASMTHYAWVTNDGTRDFVTTIISHELVEACTDPEGTAILGSGPQCPASGWCEIGDVCGTTEVVNDVRVQAYWSEADRSCVIPGSS